MTKTERHDMIDALTFRTGERRSNFEKMTDEQIERMYLDRVVNRA